MNGGYQADNGDGQAQACRTLDEANAAMAFVCALEQQRAELERKIARHKSRIEGWARRELIGLESTAVRLRHGVIGFRSDGTFYLSADPLS